MVNIFPSVIYGFEVALQPMNLMYCFFGVLIGTLVGVLPGLGPAAAIALLLPATFKVNPVSASIMLAGIYYGAMYGGSTTSILVNIPGESASVVTCLDGHQMALKGRAGPALGIAAFGSFIAGTFAVIALTFVGPLLAGVALEFGPPEYFSLMIVGITVLTYLSSGSMVKALITAGIGLMLSGVGMDTISGKYRFTFGIASLLDGITLVPVAMGLFGISEVLLNLETEIKRSILTTPLQNLFPTPQGLGGVDRADSPGVRPRFLSWESSPGEEPLSPPSPRMQLRRRFRSIRRSLEKVRLQVLRDPRPRTTPAAGSSFIPLLTLGIPSNGVMAIFLGALMIHGLQPGPLLITKAPDLFWGTIVSMYIGNGMLLVLNLPLIPMWVKVLKVPYYLLYPLILLFCLIGSYSIENDVADVIAMLIFGLLGFLMKKFQYEGAPLILALVLGQRLETSLRRSLIMSRGDFSIFISRPISLGFLIIAVLLLVVPIITQRKKLSTLKEE